MFKKTKRTVTFVLSCKSSAYTHFLMQVMTGTSIQHRYAKGVVIITLDINAVLDISYRYESQRPQSLKNMEVC